MTSRTHQEVAIRFADLLQRRRIHLNQLEALFGCLCGVMSSELFEGGEVSLPGMGKLSAVHTKARDGRNPKTGEKLHIPAKLRVTFRPSKAFRELLN